MANGDWRSAHGKPNRIANCERGKINCFIKIKRFVKRQMKQIFMKLLRNTKSHNCSWLMAQSTWVYLLKCGKC